jgi:hypothetical protein
VVSLRTISGHRDTGLTACPGQKLYDKLPSIRKGATNIGLPKIYKPSQSPNTLEHGVNSVHYRANLSGKLDWWIEIRNEAGTLVRRLSGHSKKLDRRWKGKDDAGLPVPAGEYTAEMGAENDAGKIARPKTFSLTVEVPIP